MPDVRLDRLLREEETLADLAVDEAVGHELENLDLARGRLLLEFALRGGARTGSPRRYASSPACRSRLESAAVVAVAVQDLLTLSGVHEMRIGLPGMRL